MALSDDIKRVAADHSVLFILAAHPSPPLAMACSTLGFTYKTVDFTWVKTNKDGSLFKGSTIGHAPTPKSACSPRWIAVTADDRYRPGYCGAAGAPQRQAGDRGRAHQAAGRRALSAVLPRHDPIILWHRLPGCSRVNRGSYVRTARSFEARELGVAASVGKRAADDGANSIPSSPLEKLAQRLPGIQPVHQLVLAVRPERIRCVDVGTNPLAVDRDLVAVDQDNWRGGGNEVRTDRMMKLD